MAALDAHEEERLERLLRVGTCLAMCGYGAQVGQLAATARAFRADAQLWGAHARHRGSKGRTALMFAAENGRTDCVRLLMDCGSNKEVKNKVCGSLLSLSFVFDVCSCRWFALFLLNPLIQTGWNQREPTGRV